MTTTERHLILIASLNLYEKRCKPLLDHFSQVDKNKYEYFLQLREDIRQLKQEYSYKLKKGYYK